jgi:predicted DNA-binding transcriptional regulator AlpA
VALKVDRVIRPDRTLTRKQAVNILGMTDTEFALRLIWDSEFPQAIQGGAFHEADIVAWKSRRDEKSSVRGA